jgi:hypothetical protein
MVEPAPSAAGGAMSPLKQEIPASMPARKLRSRRQTHGLLAVPQWCVALLMEGDIGNAADLDGGEIGAPGMATIGGGLPRRSTGARADRAYEALGVSGVSGFEYDIEDLPAGASHQPPASACARSKLDDRLLTVMSRAARTG